MTHVSSWYQLGLGRPGRHFHDSPSSRCAGLSRERRATRRLGLGVPMVYVLPVTDFASGSHVSSERRARRRPLRRPEVLPPARADLAGVLEAVPAGALALQLLEDVAPHVPHHRAGQELLEAVADLRVALFGLPPREQRDEVVALLEHAAHEVADRAIALGQAIVERRLALGG